MERRSNYDITRDRLERDFLQYDQEAMLRRVPLRHDADYLYLTFLRREYRIDRKTGRVEWSDDGFQTANHAGHDEVGTIFDYLCCADPSVPLTGEYVSVNQLDGVVTGTTLGNDMFEDWAKQFTGKTAALAQACEALGGNVMTDAFGLVALVAMMPLITVQVMGAIYVVKSRHASQEPQLPDFGDNEIIELWEAC